MPFIATHSAPTFDLPGTRFTGLAAPSRGSTETSAWMVEMAAGTPAVPHRLTREEIFVCLEGQAVARLDGEEFKITPGSALVVPAGVSLELSNPHALPFKALAVLPVGGQAAVGDKVFTPPWAA
jgi:quercetin dioxygenase-like cupin family protein